MEERICVNIWIVAWNVMISFVCVQLVELSNANSSQMATSHLQTSMAAVTEFVQGRRMFMLIIIL